MSAIWLAGACSALCGLELFRRAPTAALGGRSFASHPRPMLDSPNTAIWRMTWMSKSKASAAPQPVMINDSNLSRAWARLLLGVLDGAGTEVSPLVLSVTGFGENGAVPEESAVRHALDHLLKRKRRLKVEDVAFTIFPQRVWEMSRGDRARLFTLYRAT